ncbi:hypothetical protein [Solicola sp. PLA-1-18]|uniref:hypothetical protein n=1 Tax=Solicola sp. PLA-1-18 TaxID=3380532 RepID=UPI003B760EE2
MSTTEPREVEPEQKKLLGDLSLPQVIGSALAAITATVAASTLGVAGTVIGAGLASIFATVGGTIYTSSLKKTKDVVVRGTQVVRDGAPITVRTMTVKADEPAPAAAPPPQAPAELDHTTSLRALAETTAKVKADVDLDDPDRTAHLDHRTEWTSTMRPVDPTTAVPHPVPEPSEVVAEATPDAAPAAVLVTEREGALAVLRRRWKPLALVAVVLAVVSLGAVSAIEGVVGHPLSNSSGSGTSVGKAFGGGGSSSSDDQPSDDATTEPTESDSTPTPSDDETTEPEATEPTATPSPSATPTPTTRPSATATPAPTASATPQE